MPFILYKPINILRLRTNGTIATCFIATDAKILFGKMVIKKRCSKNWLSKLALKIGHSNLTLGNWNSIFNNCIQNVVWKYKPTFWLLKIGVQKLVLKNWHLKGVQNWPFEIGPEKLGTTWN